MSEMLDKNIVQGPELERITDVPLGELLLLVLKSYEDSVLQVDAATNETLRANELLARAIQLAKWLRTKGIGIGDCISINARNRIEFCIVPVATLLVGATFAPLNPDYTPGELKHVLSLSKPKIVFCTTETVDKMDNLRATNPFIKELVLFGKSKSPRIISYESLIQGADPENIDESFQSTPLDPVETVATILCSSGTTGLPKGVMCTHDNMTAYIDISRQVYQHMIAAESDSDAMMGLTPFFHSFGFMLMFLNILRGKNMVVMSKFKPKPFLEAVVKYKIARLIVPPPVLLFLLKNPLVKNYDLSHIKEMRSGAAPMGRDMEVELKERFKVQHVSQGYGMTETTLGVLVSYPGITKVGSVGNIVPGMLAKIVGENGKILGPNQEGELCFKGPLIMKGYVNDVKATKETIDSEGWLHTGDVAYYDDDKFFYIVDRIKELIKYKGFQVAPAELEALLHTHPAVQDAAVIGLPNEEAGELPYAFVVKKPGKEVTEQEIIKFVADNVSPQKQIRGGVTFLNSIPRNPTGKILRRVLKQQAIQYKSKL